MIHFSRRTARRIVLFVALAAAIMLLPALTAGVHAQTTGTTVDAFQLVTGLRSEGKAIAVDSQGNIYTAGYGYASTATGSQQYWVVRKSIDGGSTFATVMTYRYPSGSTFSGARGVTVDAFDNVYIVGDGITSKGLMRWITCKSSDGGATWRVVDDYSLGKDTGASAVCASASGALFVVGMGVPTKGGGYWLVRRSVDGGATWSTVDSFRLSSASAEAITQDAAGNLYVAGAATDSANTRRWVVRKGTAGGTSWTTIDDLAGTTGTTPRSVIVDNASGCVYVTGSAPGPNGALHATIRRGSTTATVTGGFVTVEAYQHEPGTTLATHGQAVVVGPSGELVQGLLANRSAGGSQWMIRVSYDGGASFSVLDAFQLTPGYGSAPNAFVLSGGSLLAVGRSNDAGNVYHWVTRKY